MHVREMTGFSEESGLNGARMEAEKSEKKSSRLRWVGQQIPPSQHWPLLTYTWPAPCLSGIALPPPPPRAPRAGGETRRGVALPGWSPALPPAAPLPSSGSGSAAQSNLRALQPMGGRRPCPLPFSRATEASSALRSPPQAALGVMGR